MKVLPIILFLYFAISVISCETQPKNSSNTKELIKIQFRGEAQGTYYAITYYDSLGRNLQMQIDSLLSDFDKSASNYDSLSIISKVNRNEEVTLDSVFIGNFELAKEVSLATNGLFDITVKPLVELWGFGLKNRAHVTAAEVKKAMEFVGFAKIRIENGMVVKENPAITIDFNAIAQGYSVDVVANYFKKIGITRFLVDIGGEVFANSCKPDGSKWTVGIERPEDNAEYGSNLSAILEIENKGMATSGNYRKFYVENGIRFSHTIDPRTGYPAKNSVLSATVFALNAGTADAYATALMVMGLDASIEFLKQHPELDAYLIYSDAKGNYKSFQTPGMKKYLKEENLEK